MASILVSGSINLEVSLRVDNFPIEYAPVRYPFWGVNSSISGVGYNVAAALTSLGDSVTLCSLIGSDPAGELARAVLKQANISGDYVINQLKQTAHSVIEYDPSGRRAVHVDLKDSQVQAYPLEKADVALTHCDLAVLCSINFSRPLLELALRLGKTVVTDVHVIADLEDAYNQDFMAAAHLLFMSDEHLPYPPEEWAHQVIRRYGTDVVVIGMGAHGALLVTRDRTGSVHVPAVQLRSIVNTVGAGDALLSAFVHFYHASGNPAEALNKAVLFAGYKIGAAGAAEGFLSEAEVNALYQSRKQS